ncbi:ParA family protein [Streptomyces caniscabiei]|uniref:ParA family protein n=1 Tax=Streptomyces caniscabiei TaxID=2746961 RepID=UPI001872A335|nr:ParA family protein [Streptomyces caniscabiei]MBE4761792.1 ParA family protein [Streptomyces caniscabiei]
MASPYADGDREKVASKLPPGLQYELKVRAAELGLDMQDAVTTAVTDWRTNTTGGPDIDTAGAKSFSTWLPHGLYDQFKDTCNDRGLSYIQGLAQSVRAWLDAHPSPHAGPHAVEPRRLIVGNQKGGVGKTSVTLGLGEAHAEDPEAFARELRRFIESLAHPELKRMGRKRAELLDMLQERAVGGQRVLVVDYDPQGHLSSQLGIPWIPRGEDSLVTHMVGDGQQHIRNLVVPVDDPRYAGRLHILPASFDAFLLDSRITMATASVRGFQKEVALERALRPLEDAYDVIVVDCPPSLGLAMDAALYYGRRRRNEAPNRSGVVVPVQAEDSSAIAYEILVEQMEELCKDLGLEIDYLGLVVNLYDSRRGFVATSSLEGWQAIEDQTVLAVIGDLKEQREAVRVQQPLLSYAPSSAQANIMRLIALGAGQ